MEQSNLRELLLHDQEAKEVMMNKDTNWLIDSTFYFLHFLKL